MLGLNEFYTPTNIQSEKERFLSSGKYNPIFSYNWDHVQINEWLAKKSQMKYSDLVGAILQQDIVRISKEGEVVFSSSVEEDVLDEAKQFLNEKPRSLTGQTVEELVSRYQSAFHYFDLDYIPEVVNAHGFNARPRPSQRKVIISKYINLQYFSLECQVRHEIVHVLRAENSMHNRISKTATYLPTEEGLASFMQDKGLEENYSQFQHAAEYAVTQVGLEGSLREMVDYLCELGFERDLAWQRASRHKFGFVDTSQPGDIMKPSMYFYNQQKISDLGKEDILRLFVGKIGLSDLETVREYTGKVDEAKILEYFNI